MSSGSCKLNLCVLQCLRSRSPTNGNREILSRDMNTLVPIFSRVAEPVVKQMLVIVELGVEAVGKLLACS